MVMRACGNIALLRKFYLLILFMHIYFACDNMAGSGHFINVSFR